jgi:hypothetical protein
MAAAKKKTKFQAGEVEVGKRTLEGVLIDLAEQVKANDARCANRIASIEERSARIEERSARIEERSARAEEMAALALQTIASVSQDLRALTQEMRAANLRHDARFGALEEKTAGA